MNDAGRDLQLNFEFSFSPSSRSIMQASHRSLEYKKRKPAFQTDAKPSTYGVSYGTMDLSTEWRGGRRQRRDPHPHHHHHQRQRQALSPLLLLVTNHRLSPLFTVVAVVFVSRP
jgi:hypothetical protein